MTQHKRTVYIGRSAGLSTAADGEPGAGMMIKDRRSKKVGVLPDLARVVLAAAETCLDGTARAAPERTGVSLGTVYGSMNAVETSLTTARTEGFGAVVPSWYATGLPNATAAIVASLHGMGGPNLTFLGRQAGIDAIVAASRQIVLDRADAMLCGAFDLPSTRFNAALAGAAAGGSAHGGVGLVWLSAEAAAAHGRILGWIQQGVDRAVTPETLVDRVREQAAVRHRPTLHRIRDDDLDGRDFLAATAPLYLVERVLAAGQPGVHALVVGGSGDATSCLLVETF